MQLEAWSFFSTLFATFAYSLWLIRKREDSVQTGCIFLVLWPLLIWATLLILPAIHWALDFLHLL